MEKYFIFSASGVDSSSVTSHDTGTNIDLACFPTRSLTAIMGEEDFVYLYFKEATRFEANGMTVGATIAVPEVMEQSYVRLGVGEGMEATVVKDLIRLINGGPHSDGTILFDAVNGVWPISNVEDIQIRRHLTSHTLASDS